MCEILRINVVVAVGGWHPFICRSKNDNNAESLVGHSRVLSTLIFTIFFLPGYLQYIMVKFTMIIALLLPLSSAFSIRDRIRNRLSGRFAIEVFDDVHLPAKMSFIAKAWNQPNLQKEV